MTRDEVLAMKPGRELDALVAEKVMGWRKKTFPGGGGGYTAWVDENGKALKLISNFTMIEACRRCDYFRPSIDIAAAWEVVEKMAQEYDVSVWSDRNGKWACEINCVIVDDCDTAHEAICKAALLAVMDG